MRSALLLFLLLLLALPIGAASRLPESVVPIHYAIRIDVDLAGEAFRGEETIDVDLRESTDSIVLHSVGLALYDAAVQAGDRHLAASVTPDEANGMVTLRLPQIVSPGRATIAIRFDGKLTDSLEGLYLSRSGNRKYAATQFENTAARRAFPCFDEPAMKATFDVTLVVDDGDTAISNEAIVSDTPAGGGKHAVRFGTTPRLPTYLLAFLVGDFKCIEGSAGKVPLRVCSRPGLEHLGRFGLEAAKVSMAWFERYYGIPYPFGKLDMIAIPDFEAGAMENAGAVTFRETDLLIDEKTAAEPVRRRVAVVVSHEVAHMWFGDLVTMQWWDDVWLNEGFATLMEGRPLADWKPEWQSDLEDVARTRSVLAIDAQRSTRPIRSEGDVDWEITYYKPQYVLEMVESWIGPDAFRDAIRTYLRKYAWGNASAEDFLATMKAASQQPVDEVLKSFIDLPGAPLLRLSESCEGGQGRVSIAQESMLPAGQKGPGRTWTIPVCSRALGGSPDEQCRVISKPSDSLRANAPCGRPLLLGRSGTGYYAVDYPAGMRLAFRRSLGEMSEAERIALLGNEWLLVKNVRRDAGEYLRLVGRMPRGASRPQIAATAGSLTWLGDRLVDDHNREAFGEFVRRTVRGWAPATWTAPKGETAAQRSARAAVLGLLGDEAGDRLVLEGARKVAAQYMRDPSTVDALIAGTALQLSALGGDQAFFDRLVKAAHDAPTPELALRYRYTITAFRDPKLVGRAISYVLGEEVRSQDRPKLLEAMLGDPATRNPAWTAIEQRWPELEKASPWLLWRTAQGASDFCDPESRQRLASFFASHPGGEATARRVLESVDTCIAFRTAQQRTFDNALGVESR